MNILNQTGITRFNPEIYDLFEAYFRRRLEELAGLLSEEMKVDGVKTLRKKQLNSALENLKKQEKNFEI